MHVPRKIDLCKPEVGSSVTIKYGHSQKLTTTVLLTTAAVDLIIEQSKYT